MKQTDERLLLLSPDDNVLVLRQPIERGAELMVEGEACTLADTIPLGHKLARQPIAVGAKIFKYGVPIGSATADIPVGAHVHVHNAKSDYTASHTLDDARAASDEKE